MSASAGILRLAAADPAAGVVTGDIRSHLLAVARAEIGVQERSGRNDGERVGEYLAYCGLSEGYEWCAAFVSWCYGQLGLSEPRTPWSPALFPADRLVWRIGSTSVRTPRPGDVFGIWIREKGRIGHAGLVESWDAADGWCITMEGNSGDAVRRLRRPTRTLYRVADWIGSASGSLLEGGAK